MEKQDLFRYYFFRKSTLNTKDFKKRRNAFTLIELLVAIAIIALLSSIVLATLKGARDRAKIASGIQFSGEVYHALGAYAVGMWDFDEGSGTTAYDSSDNDNNGAIIGAVYKCADADTSNTFSGKGCSLYFSGSGDKIQISNPLGISDKSFTISHWVKTIINAGQVYTVGNAGGGNGYRFGIGGGKIQFLIGNSTGYTEKVCGATAVNDGKWHLITGVFDRGNFFKCYVDGKEDGSVVIPFYSGMSDTAPGIGAPPCCVDFEGLIDDVRIYGEALSSAQIQKIYVEGMRKHGLLAKE